MALLKEQKDAVIGDNRTHAADTGSPEVQVALLTRLDQRPDGAPQGAPARYPHPARTGLKLGPRSRLLKYLASKDINRYRALVGKLGIRSRL